MVDINDFNKYRRMSVEYSSTNKTMDMLNNGETPQQQLRRGSMPHILYGGNKNIWNNDDNEWKAVGSPPRRPSFSATSGLGYTVNNNNPLLSQNLRNNGVPSIIKEDTENVSSLLNPNATNKSGVNIPQNLPGQWDSLASSWSGGSSIWKSNYSNSTNLGPTSSLLNSTSTSRNDPFSTFGSTSTSIQPPAPRQYRSFSVSVGALGPMNENFGGYPTSNAAAAAAAALTSQFPLSEKDEIENERMNRLSLKDNRIDEADEVNDDLDMLSELIDNKGTGLGGLDSYGNSKIRSRSKSSSDTFGIMGNYNMNNTMQNHQRYHSQKNFNNYIMGNNNKNNLSSAFLNNNNLDIFSNVLNNTTTSSTGADLQSKNSLLSPLITNTNNGNGLNSSIMTTAASMTPTSQLTNNSNNFMLSSANDATSILTTPTTSTAANTNTLLTQQQQQQQQQKLMFSNVNIPTTLADANMMNMNDMTSANVNNTNTGMNTVNMLSNQWTNNTGITSTTSSPFRSTTENQALAHKRSNTQPAYPLWNNNNGNNAAGDPGFTPTTPGQNAFMNNGMAMGAQTSQPPNQPNPNMGQMNGPGNMMTSNDFMNNPNNRMPQVQNNPQQPQRNRFYNNMFNGNNQNGMNQPMYQPTFDQNFNGHNDMDFMMQQQFGMRRNSDMSMNTMMPMYQNMPMGMNGMGMNGMGMNNNMNNMMMPHYGRGHNGMMMMNGGDNMYINDINDYFENTEYRTRAWVEAGKNLHQMQQNVYHWPLYVIEFKAGRTDYFYVPENSGLTIKIGDLVIVEADRGKDLGKVIVNNIKNLAQLVAYHAERGNPRHLIIDDDMNNNNVPNIPITWPKGQNGEGANDTNATTTTEGDKDKAEGKTDETNPATTTATTNTTDKDDDKKDTTSSDKEGSQGDDNNKDKTDTKEEDKREEGKEKTTADGEKETPSEENLQFPKDIHPKRIYRMAQPAEVNMLVQKNTDENSSMLLCQQKVRQRNMPMEVVDAEYQWDRRKLTFYFVSERRIDFRELVRDLFKVYKTRIWMCAVSSLTTMKAYQAFNINIVSPSNMTEQTIAQLQNMTIEDKKEEGEGEKDKKEGEGDNKVDANATTTTTEVKEENKEDQTQTTNQDNKTVEAKDSTPATDVKESTTLDATGASKVPVQTPTPPPSLPPSQVQTPK